MGAYDNEVLADSPTFYLPLDADADDVSGNDRHFTAFGSPIFGPTGMVLNGTSQYIERADEDAFDFLGTAAFTMELWLTPDLIDTSFRRLMGHITASDDDGYSIYLHSTQGVRFVRAVATAAVFIPTSGAALLTVATLYHLVATYDGSDVRFYVDTTPFGPNGAATSMAAVAQPFTIGRSNLGSQDYVQGTIRRAALYPTALSLARIEAHYAAAQVQEPVLGLDRSMLRRRRAWVGFGDYFNDYWAPRAPAGGSVVVTMGVASLTTNRFAPTVLTPRLVTPATASLSLATFAPTVLTPRLVTMGKLTLTLSTFAPSVTAGQGLTVTLGRLDLVTATFAPSVTTTAHVKATLGTAALTLTAFAPRLDLKVIMARATLALSTFAPSVQTPRHVVMGLLSLITTAFAPTIAAPRIVTMGRAALSLVAFAPSLALKITMGVAALLITRFAPTVTSPHMVTMNPRALLITTFASTVSTTANVVVRMMTAALAILSFAPTVTGTPPAVSTSSIGAPSWYLEDLIATDGLRRKRRRKKRRAAWLLGMFDDR